MHGTETPAQPNDPTNFEFPPPDANLFGDIDQNLDFDSQMETGQWRHMQQVIEWQTFHVVSYPFLTNRSLTLKFIYLTTYF